MPIRARTGMEDAAIISDYGFKENEVIEKSRKSVRIFS